MEQTPDILVLERQFGNLDAEGSKCVFDRIGERCWHHSRNSFALALGAQRRMGRGHVLVDDLELARHIHRRQQVIVRQGNGQLLARFIVNVLFARRITQSHPDPAVNLPPHDHRVDRQAGIVHRHVFQDSELAGIGKYLDGEGVYVATMHAGGRSLEMVSMLQSGIDSGRQLGRRHDGDVSDLAQRDPFGRIFYPDYLAGGEPELLDFSGLGREFEQVGGDPANPGSQGARRQHGGAQRV
jgi:hypothetical protein